MKTFLIVTLLLLPMPSWAQSHADVVASVKADLQARGVNLTDACGAFQITKRVAWRLRSEGAGTLDKPSGSNCEGRATDIIAYPDGRIVDILTDAGGTNGPSWSLGDPVDPSRWRPALDPGDAGGAPIPVPIPAPVVVDLSGVTAKLDALDAQLERIFADLAARDAARAAQIASLDAHLTQHDTDPSWVKKVLTNANTYVAILGALGGYFAHGATK